MKLSLKYLAFVILSVGWITGFQVRAQDDGAPLEAPYADETNEFEDALSSEQDVFGNSEIKEATPIEVVQPQEPRTQPAPVKGANGVMKRNAKGGVEYIEHPQAAKGLIRIEKDGAYIYRTTDKTTDKKPESISFRFGTMDPPKIQAAGVVPITFVTMYTSSAVPIVMLDYEWQPFSGFGKLGVVGGFGLMTASGNGRFADGRIAEEKYTFYGIPVNLGALYRLEFMDTQWVAPYLGGGGTYFGVIETRDDGKSTNVVGVPGAYGSGGAMFNISAIDRDTAFTLRNEYGIRNLWATLEYRYVKTFSDDVDFSSGILNFGVAVDY